MACGISPAFQATAQESPWLLSAWWALSRGVTRQKRRSPWRHRSSRLGRARIATTLLSLEPDIAEVVEEKCPPYSFAGARRARHTWRELLTSAMRAESPQIRCWSAPNTEARTRVLSDLVHTSDSIRDASEEHSGIGRTLTWVGTNSSNLFFLRPPTILLSSCFPLSQRGFGSGPNLLSPCVPSVQARTRL